MIEPGAGSLICGDIYKDRRIEVVNDTVYCLGSNPSLTSNQQQYRI